MTGPLHGIRVVELAGLAPAPFAGMMVADLGADVTRIERPGRPADPLGPGDVATGWQPDPLARGRRSVALDLKDPAGLEAALQLVDAADVMLEGYRPGVCERLGIGPDTCRARNPRLVYARLSGWGQHGPLAGVAGHDLTYLAIAGALHPIGPAGEPPTPPLNYVADFGGGGMLAATGILAALVERGTSGRGQVVDVAMVDGASLMTAHLRGLRATGRWDGPRGQNVLDGGAPFYRCYTCGDGRYVAVAALEPAFFAALVEGLDLDPASLPSQFDREGWPVLRERFAAAFATRARDTWADHFAGTDACVAPVLTPDEATRHPQARARDSYVDVEGVPQPAPAPRFSGTPPEGSASG